MIYAFNIETLHAIAQQGTGKMSWSNSQLVFPALLLAAMEKPDGENACCLFQQRPAVCCKRPSRPGTFCELPHHATNVQAYRPAH
jgi:hypothetical protein